MRESAQSRKTKETQIQVNWNLDGTGTYKIQTAIPFLNHMLDLFAKHGYFDLTIKASGDTDIDDHHLAEDLGITMGLTLKEALGDKKGIKRYGECILPMDEALVLVALDLSNRPHLEYDVTFQAPLQNFDAVLVKEFFAALVNNAGLTLHIKLLNGDNTHHILEAIFKGFAKALDRAIAPESRETEIPSTKGII